MSVHPSPALIPDDQLVDVVELVERLPDLPDPDDPGSA